MTIVLNAVLHVSSSNLHISFSNLSTTLYDRSSLRILRKIWKICKGSEVIDGRRVGEQRNTVDVVIEQCDIVLTRLSRNIVFLQ